MLTISQITFVIHIQRKNKKLLTMATQKANTPEITEDDIQASILLNDPNFRKFAAEEIKAGRAPKKEAAPAPEAGGAAAPPKKNPANQKDTTFFKKPTEPEIKGIDTKEKFDALVKEKFGIEVDKGYDTLVASAMTWRKQAQTGAEAEKKLQAVDKNLKNLPPVIKAGIQAFGNAQDWKKAIIDNLSRLDYNVPVDNYKKEELASHYFTKKVEDAKAKLADKKIDQDAYDTLIETFHTAAISKFNSEKSEFEASKLDIIRQNEENAKNLTKSVDTTIAHLKQKFTDFDDSKLTEVKSHLEGNLFALFYNEDGTAKEDAGLKLALALYGEEEISSRVGEAIKDSANDTALDLIEGAHKKPIIPAGGGGAPNAEAIDPETKTLFKAMSLGEKVY